MKGIYKITNNINGKVYIGFSVNIEARYCSHLQRAFSNTPNNKEYEKSLYRAIRKYGPENFSLEVVELTDDFKEREKYWISHYNSYKEGYNETYGGEGVTGQIGEKHPKTKLTDSEVYYIREQYNNRRAQKEVYEEFKHLIGPSGFKKIWNGVTWKHIHMDVYTPENKAHFLFERNSNSENNSHAILTIADVVDIRTRKKNGEDPKEVYKDYQVIKYHSFLLVWNNKNWKKVVV